MRSLSDFLENGQTVPPKRNGTKKRTRARRISKVLKAPAPRLYERESSDDSQQDDSSSTCSLTVDCSVMSRSVADGACSFRPDESVCGIDLEDTDFGEVRLSSTREMPHIEEEEGREEYSGAKEDNQLFDINGFIQDRVDTFSRNVDFCQGLALQWTKDIEAMLNWNSQ